MFKRMIDCVWSILIKPLHSRQKKLFKDRGVWEKEQFVDHFSALGFDRDIAVAVWDVLVPEYVVFDQFKPKPEDSFYYVFGLAEEDLDEDVVLKVLKRCGCRIPAPDETAKMDPVETVADLVKFASQLKQ